MDSMGNAERVVSLVLSTALITGCIVQSTAEPTPITSPVPSGAKTPEPENTPLPYSTQIRTTDTVTPSVVPSETVQPAVCENKTVSDLEKNGIGIDLTVAPLSEAGLKTIGGYETLRPGLVAAVDNLALKFGKEISSRFTAVVVPEYAYDQVLKDMAVQNAALGTNMGVIKYDANNPVIFNNPNVMWMVEFYGENGGGLVKDKDGNEGLMYTNVTGITEHAGGKLKPDGEMFVFSNEKDANDKEIVNVRPYPGQAVGGKAEVAEGCYGSRIVMVDANGKIFAVLLDNPRLTEGGKLSETWKFVEVASVVDTPTLVPTIQLTVPPAETATVATDGATPGATGLPTGEATDSPEYKAHLAEALKMVSIKLESPADFQNIPTIPSSQFDDGTVQAEEYWLINNVLPPSDTELPKTWRTACNNATGFCWLSSGQISEAKVYRFIDAFFVIQDGVKMLRIGMEFGGKDQLIHLNIEDPKYWTSVAYINYMIKILHGDLGWIILIDSDDKVYGPMMGKYTAAVTAARQAGGDKLVKDWIKNQKLPEGADKTVFGFNTVPIVK